MAERNTNRPVLEMRVALTASDYERSVNFYTRALGLEPDQIWTDGGGRGQIIRMGDATLEVFDEGQAAAVDEIEIGRRVSGQIRFALRVPDMKEAMERLQAHGAKLVHAPIVTPWGHQNARFEDPDGIQITLFQVMDASKEG
jgi:lactoylglutathione lyase